MGIFGKRSSPELEAMIDQLARSYMRGHRLNDGAQRDALVEEIAATASRLRAGGSGKAVDGTRDYTPHFLGGFPYATQMEIKALVRQALG